MTATSTEQLPADVVTFRDARWETRWIFVGLAFLFLWRCTALLDREWLARWPAWLLLILNGLAPQVFLLLFPIVTRKSRRGGTLGFPTLTRGMIEFAIAIPVVIATIFALATINYLLGRLSPGTSVTPDAIKDIAGSSETTFVYLTLLFSFTFAPVAEEVFFRGFLYNALRARMPMVVAIAAQCLIFGFAHFYGVLHAGIVAFLGLVLTLHYEWRKSLIAPILVHAGMNLFAAIGVVFLMTAHADNPVLGVVGDPQDTVCVIRKVVPDTAAAKAELQVGDVITSLNGERISDFKRLVEIVRRYRPGDTVTVTIERDGVSLEVDAVLQRRGAPIAR
jgi:membrane protease YdiL (CAAX protease family)